jgi:hypothetical protein
MVQINSLKLSDEKLDETIKLWNEVQPATNIKKAEMDDPLKDSIYIIEKPHDFLHFEEIDRFRCLSKIIYLNKNLIALV